MIQISKKNKALKIYVKFNIWVSKNFGHQNITAISSQFNSVRKLYKK